MVRPVVSLGRPSGGPDRGCHVWLRLGSNMPEGEAEALAAAFPGVRFSVDLEPGDLAGVEVVYTSGRLDDQTVASLRALKWIHTTYGGGASFLTPDVVARGIAVTSSRGVQAEPLSEFTEACVLALAKKLPALARLKDKRQWDEEVTLDTLTGGIAGLLGLGAVGSAVARRLHGHGMRVRAIRRNLADCPPYVDRVLPMDALGEILAEADYLIIGLPAIEALKGLMGEAELRAMKPTSHLINLVSRGIVDDDALLKALSEGWIAGAACNVFATNPLPADSGLWDAPNLIISPNVAQKDPLRWQKLKAVFAANLERYLAGAPMENVVDGEGAY